MAAHKRRIPITIGADPEMFLKDVKTGKLVSAHDKMPGDKLHPHPCTGGAMQVDGVAAEFNITPQQTGEHFAAYCQAVMKEVQNKVGANYTLVLEPTAVFDDAYWRSLPDKVKELGCNPDYNAWTGKANPPPDRSVSTMRTAAGHVHIGWTKDKDVYDQDHYEDCELLVKQLDYYLGVPGLVFDASPTRRTLYGKAGAFRPKPYGLEYRVLSNKWLTSPALMSWVFRTAYKCVDDMMNGAKPLEEKYQDLARKAIDNSEKYWVDQNHPLFQLKFLTGVEPPLAHLDPAWDKTKKAEHTKETPKSPRTAKFMYDKKLAVPGGVFHGVSLAEAMKGSLMKDIPADWGTFHANAAFPTE